MVKQCDIQHYGMDVRDLDTSAFEMLEMLHLQSKIHRYFYELSTEKRTRLRVMIYSLSPMLKRFMKK